MSTLRRPRPVFWPAMWSLLAGAVFFIAADPFLSPPDCAFYWAWGAALSHDLSFDFSPAYEALDMPVRYCSITVTDRLSNDWPPGTGFMLLPAVRLGPLFAHAWVILLAAAVIALWWRFAPFSSGERAAGLIGMLAGTPLLFYLCFGPFFSHVTSFAMTSLFLLLWQLTLDRPERKRLWLVCGWALGFAAVVRPQNVLLGVAFLPNLAMSIRARRISAGPWLALAAGVIAGLLPRFPIYQVLYGSPWALPKAEEMLWLRPAILKTLFSDYHGILPWTPVYVPAIAGLLWLLRANAKLACGLLLVFAAQLYINAANMVWWSGGSFGNRRLADSALIVGYGCAALVAAAKPGTVLRLSIGFIGGCCAWTLWLMLAERRLLVPLDRYVPFGTRDFAQSMLRVFTDLGETAAAVSRPLAQGDSLGTHAAASVILAVGIWILIRMQMRLRTVSVARIAPMLAVAMALTMFGVSVVAARRTPEITDAGLRARLGTQSAILWDNYIELAFYELSNGRYRQAEAASRKAIALRPDHYSGWWYLTSSLLNQNRAEEGLAACREVLSLHPEHRGALDIMARAMASQRTE